MSFLSLIDHALILLTILLEKNFMQIHNVHYITTGVRGVTSEIYLTSIVVIVWILLTYIDSGLIKSEHF